MHFQVGHARAPVERGKGPGWCRAWERRRGRALAAAGLGCGVQGLDVGYRVVRGWSGVELLTTGGSL